VVSNGVTSTVLWIPPFAFLLLLLMPLPTTSEVPLERSALLSASARFSGQLVATAIVVSSDGGINLRKKRFFMCALHVFIIESVARCIVSTTPIRVFLHYLFFLFLF
jgi:hypothetical protein